MFVKKRIADITHLPIRVLKKVQRRLLALPFVQKINAKAYVPDKKYVMKEYEEQFGKPMDMKHPKTFNEKNNWRKIYDRKPIYTSMADKYLLKGIIAERVGSQYAIPLLGAWDTPEEIDWNSLPDQFVLKCNHESGSVVVCRNLQDFDRQRAVAALNKKLKTNYYHKHREWPYKNVRRKILAEEFLGDNLISYNNYCFNGKIQYTIVWKNHSRRDGFKPTIFFCGAYDRQWKRSEIELDYPSEGIEVEKPIYYEEMIHVAEKMSAKEIPFVRVDCYIIKNRVYIGEVTFFPWGGFQKFKDEKWDRMLGDMEKLPGIDD